MAFPAVKPRRRERGMSLFETMLAVGVSAVFFAFVINLGNVIAREQAIQAAANYVNQIDRATTQMLNNPARFTAMYNTLLAAGGQGQATINDLRNSTGIIGAANVPPGTIPPNPILGATFPDPGPLNQTYRILFRIADNMANPNDIQVIETYIASQSLIDDDFAMRVAGALGGKGGALRDTANPAVGVIRGAFGNWSAPIVNLAATAWFTAVTTAVNPPTTNNGGYVVAYHYFDQQRIAKDYLYRVNTVPAALNRMESDLDMNNYNVLGVDNVNTAGVMTGSEVQVQGAGTVTGATAITGNLQGDSNASATGDITATGNLSLSAPGGTLSASTATAGNSLFASTLSTNALNTNQLSAQRGQINNGNWNTTGTTGINAGTTAGGLNVSGTTNANGRFETSNLNTGNLTVPTGDTGMIYMQASNSYNHTSGSTQTSRYSGASLTSVGNTDWRCGSGC